MRQTFNYLFSKNKILLADIMEIMAVLMVAIALFTLVISCSKSSEQKLADAKVNAIEANQNVKEAVQAEANDEWLKFKAAYEVKIAENDSIVAAYKAKMKKADGKLKTKYDKKIDALEKKNNELKAKLDDYKDSGKSAWEQFKSEFTHDMDELGTALKDFTVDNKK